MAEAEMEGTEIENMRKENPGKLVYEKYIPFYKIKFLNLLVLYGLG